MSIPRPPFARIDDHAQFFRRLAGFLGGRRLESDLEDEVRFHIEMLARDYVRKGMSDMDARRFARSEA